MPADLRPATGQGVDESARPVVRVAGGPRALSRPVAGAPRRDHAAAGGLAGCHARGPAGVRTALPDRRATLGRWALYLRAELHRLRGEFSQAEEAYREASHSGREPQPGLAQLRLAQGKGEAAAATIRRVMEEARDPITRSRLLAPYVEIMLAANDVRAARAGADELAGIAEELEAPLLRADTLTTAGAVLAGADVDLTVF